MKDKLIKTIREVPIADKSYPEYVEALADKLLDNSYRKDSDVAREIFEEIEKALEQAKEIADVRIKELAPYTYKVMREAGKLYHRHDSDAIAELKKKYTENKGE